VVELVFVVEVSIPNQEPIQILVEIPLMVDLVVEEDVDEVESLELVVVTLFLVLQELVEVTQSLLNLQELVEVTQSLINLELVEDILSLLQIMMVLKPVVVILSLINLELVEDILCLNLLCQKCLRVVVTLHNLQCQRCLKEVVTLLNLLCLICLKVVCLKEVECQRCLKVECLKVVVCQKCLKEVVCQNHKECLKAAHPDLKKILSWLDLFLHLVILINNRR
jgi:hypothetical protein